MNAPFPLAFPRKGVVSQRDVAILTSAAVHHDRASAVAGVHGLSSRQVRNIWSKGELAGFVVRLRGTWPMFYDKGPRWAELESPNAPFWTLNPILNSPSQENGTLRARVHNAMLTFEIVHGAPAGAWDSLTWHKAWTMGRQGVESRSTTISLPNADESSCVEIRGSTLIVRPFPIYARTPEEFTAIPENLRDSAKRIAHAAVQALGITIEPEPTMKGAEIAIENVDSVESLHLSRSFRFRLGATWTDASEGRPEWETSDFVLASRTFLFLWGVATGRAQIVWKDGSMPIDSQTSKHEDS